MAGPLQELIDGIPDSNLRALDLGNNSLTGSSEDCPGAEVVAIQIIARGLTSAGAIAGPTNSSGQRLFDCVSNPAEV